MIRLLPDLPTYPQASLLEVDNMEQGTQDRLKNLIDRLGKLKSYYDGFNTRNTVPGILARLEASLKEWETREENMEMHISGMNGRMARINAGLGRLELLARGCEAALEVADQADEGGDETCGETGGET